MIITIHNISMILTIGGKDLLLTKDLLGDLREYFSITVPGSYWAKQYRKGWDGKTYYITESGKMLTGFLPILLRFLDNSFPQIPVEIKDERGDIPMFTDHFMSSVGKFKMDGKFDHQGDLVKQCNNWITFREQRIYFPRGIIDAATNAGKTIMFSGIVFNLGQPVTLLLIHRKLVFNQLVKELGEFFPRVGSINDKGIDIQYPITVAMVKFLHIHLEDSDIKDYLKKCKVVLVDECHVAGSATYVKVMSRIDAGVRIYMSGSAMDSGDILSKMNMIKMSGERLGEISKRQLMDKGISKEVVVHMYLNKPVIKVPIITYDEHIQHLVCLSESRAMVMHEMIRDLPSPHVIIAVDFVDHALYLRDFFILNKLFDSTEIGVIYGKNKENKGILAGFINGDFPLLISTSVLQEGINIPLVNGLIYAVGKHSRIKIKQWMGRAERLGTASQAIFMDFYDLGLFVEKDTRKRLALYNSLGIKVEWKFDRKSLKKLYK